MVPGAALFQLRAALNCDATMDRIHPRAHKRVSWIVVDTPKVSRGKKVRPKACRMLSTSLAYFHLRYTESATTDMNIRLRMDAGSVDFSISTLWAML